MRLGHECYILDDVDPLEAQMMHVYPLGDLRWHVLDKSCWCRPTYSADDGFYSHHAMDGREAYETGERKMH